MNFALGTSRVQRGTVAGAAGPLLPPSGSPTARVDPESSGATGLPNVPDSEGTSGVALISPGRPSSSAEPRSLVRARLIAATLIMFGAIGIFFLRSFFLWFAPVQVLHSLVVLGLGLCLVLLRSPVAITLRQLRGLELVIFGVVTLFLGVYQYALVSHRLEDAPRPMAKLSLRRPLAHLTLLSEKQALANTVSGSGALSIEPVRPGSTGVQEVSATLGSTVMYIMVLMLIYGMLIPNTWWRAACVVVPMALSTVAVAFLLCWRFPELAQLSTTAFGHEQVSNDLLMLGVGVVLSVYGTHLIHSLREAAHEARQLGQYVLHRRIGEGGMGEVYLAEHRLLKRPCALKLIRPDRASDDRTRARFEREVKAMARLSHWNSVEIYDYGRTKDGTFYYVMEYLRGPSLEQLVRRHGPLPPGRVIYLLRQACDALAEAHSLGLVHRDLKPANIVAAESGGRYDVTKLLDFGLVKPLEDATSVEMSQDGVVTGSPLFMSPEQATGERRPDGRSDLYSLGAVAYFLLTGQAPFERPNAVQVMVAHVHEPVAPPSRIRPDLPADLEAVVLRCLAKFPAARFPDADSLGRALAACASASEWDATQAAAWWQGPGRELLSSNT